MIVNVNIRSVLTSIVTLGANGGKGARLDQQDFWRIDVIPSAVIVRRKFHGFDPVTGAPL